MRYIQKLSFITIVVIMATACGTVRKIPQEQISEVGRLSFSPKVVANALQTGWQIAGEWDEYRQIHPSQGPDDPASGWLIADIDGDGKPEHVFPQYQLHQEGATIKLVLVSLYIKKSDGTWEKADSLTIDEINSSMRKNQWNQYSEESHSMPYVLYLWIGVGFFLIIDFIYYTFYLAYSY